MVFIVQQIVTFEWEDISGIGFNVTQVVHDGDQFRPVIGGIHSGPLTRRGHFEHQFNIDGEFKFVRCVPSCFVFFFLFKYFDTRADVLKSDSNDARRLRDKSRLVGRIIQLNKLSMTFLSFKRRHSLYASNHHCAIQKGDFRTSH